MRETIVKKTINTLVSGALAVSLNAGCGKDYSVDRVDMRFHGKYASCKMANAALVNEDGEIMEPHNRWHDRSLILSRGPLEVKRGNSLHVRWFIQSGSSDPTYLLTFGNGKCVTTSVHVETNSRDLFYANEVTPLASGAVKYKLARQK